jgi:hypothetical protein
MAQEQQERQNTTFEVTFGIADEQGLIVRRITAANVTGSTELPGFVQLWDENGQSVAWLNPRDVTMIRRADSDPSSAAKAQVTFTGPPTLEGQMAQLRGDLEALADLRAKPSVTA